MARKGSKKGRTWARYRSWLARGLAASGLLSIGVCLGVVLGSVLDGPRLFVRRLTQATQRVELRPSTPESDPLLAFRALQRARPTPPPVVRPSPPSAASQPPPSVGPSPPRAAPPSPPPVARPSPTPRARPPVAAAPRPPAPAPEPKVAERVIAEIAARDKSARSGPVVQVAAYADRQMAEALVRRLQKRGFDSYISDTQPRGSHRFRVRVRPPLGKSANRLAARLESEGHGVWITKE